MQDTKTAEKDIQKNKHLPVQMDSVDIAVLVYLYENGNNYYSARTVREVSTKNPEITIKQHQLGIRIRELKRKKLLQNGLKTSRAKSYFITEAGKKLLESSEEDPAT